MLSALLAVTLAGQTKSLLERAQIAYDAKNAYCDYMRAAEIVENDYAFYEQAALNPAWAKNAIERSKLPEPRGEKGEEVRPKPNELAIARELLSKRPLEVRRITLVKFKDVLSLIESAEKKDCYSARKSMDFTTGFPELAPLRSVAKFLCNIAAEVDYADGRPVAGTAKVVSALRMSTAIQVEPTFIHALVGRVIRNLAITQFSGRLSQLSLPEAAAYRRIAELSLTAESPYVRAAELEVAVQIKTVEQIFANEANIEELLGSDLGDLAKRIKAVPVQSRATQIREARAWIERLHRPLIAALKGDERAMSAYTDSDEAQEQYPAGQGLGVEVADIMVVPGRNMARFAILDRVQPKLMRLACAITEYRWMNSRLPTKLYELGEPDIITDPITSAPYVYRVNGSTFELTAKGSKLTGDITLNWKDTRRDSQPPPP